MIIQRDPNERKKPVEKTEDERKEEMLEELRKESLSVICLACVYAKKLEETGMDITERWATAEQQSEIIQNFYYQGYENGYYDGIHKGKEIERAEHMQMQQDEYRHEDSFYDPTSKYGQGINLAKIIRHSRKKSPTKKKRRYGK